MKLAPVIQSKDDQFQGYRRRSAVDPLPRKMGEINSVGVFAPAGLPHFQDQASDTSANLVQTHGSNDLRGEPEPPPAVDGFRQRAARRFSIRYLLDINVLVDGADHIDHDRTAAWIAESREDRDLIYSSAGATRERSKILILDPPGNALSCCREGDIIAIDRPEQT